MIVHSGNHSRQRSCLNGLALSLMLASLPVAAQDTTPSQKPADRGPREPRGFGGPIVLNEDDKPAFPKPPADWDVKREGIPHGKLEMTEYDSKTVAHDGR